MARSTIPQYALFSGLCALIPLPLVDAWALRRVRASLYSSLMEEVGHQPREDTCEELTRDTSGFFPGCLVALVVWPFKKLFRTVVFVLLIKDGLDLATETIHRGLMVAEAVRMGLLPDRVGEVRAATDAACASMSISPMNRTFLLKAAPSVPRDEEAGRGRLGWLAWKLHHRGGGALVMPAFIDEVERRILGGGGEE